MARRLWAPLPPGILHRLSGELGNYLSKLASSLNRIPSLEAGDGYAESPDALRSTSLQISDGITEPSTISGYASIYVDTADGDLKVKFGDGTVKTIVIDT